MSEEGFKTKVLFNNIDVTNYVKNYDVERDFKNKTAVANLLVLSSVNELVPVNNYTEVDIYRNLNGPIVEPDDRIFHGSIETAEIQAGIIKIYAEDELAKAKSDINIIYLDTDPTAGIISEIFKDIIENQLGLKADAQDSGTQITVKRFACLNAEALERINKLAGLIDWQFFQDPVTLDIVFREMSFETNTNTLNYQNGILGRLKWTNNDSELGNVITCIGGRQITRTIETFSGNGNNKEFIVTKSPVDTIVKVGGVVKKVGNEQSSNVDVYVDYDRKKFTFVTAPPNAANNVVIEYTYINPIIITVKDPTSISNYKTAGFNGEYVRTFTFTDLMSVYDVEKRASELLNVYKDPFISTKILINNSKVRDFNIKVGQIIRVQDSLNKIDDYFLIKSHKMRYPMAYDEIEIGDEEVRMSSLNFEILERLKRIEESNLSESDIAINLISQEEDILIEFEEMSLTYTYLNDSAILSNERHIHLGDSKHIFKNPSPSNFTTTDYISTDSSIKIVGTHSLKYTSTDTNCSLTGSINNEDYSKYTGVNNDIPTQGTIGVWVYLQQGQQIDNFQMKIGSGPSHYIGVVGKLWANHCEVGGVTNHPQIEGWNYFIFDLDNPNLLGYTPNWKSVSYIKFEWEMEVGDIYLDFITISASNYSPSFLGKRVTHRTFEVIT